MVEKCEKCYRIVRKLYIRKCGGNHDTKFFYCKPCNVIYESSIKQVHITKGVLNV